MPVILNGKNLVGGELNGKKLKYVYNGDKLIWQDVVPVAFDSMGAGSNHATAPTWDHVVTSAGRVIVVGVALSNVTPVITGTIGGQPLTSHTLVDAGVYTSTYHVWFFALTRDGITPGSKTVSVSISSSLLSDCNSFVYTNVGSLGAPVVKSYSNTDPHSTLVEVAANGMAISAAFLLGAATFSHTHRYGGAAGGGLGVGDTATPGPQTLAWTYGANGAGAAMAIPINPA